MRKMLICLNILTLALLVAMNIQAEEIGGVEFPDGTISFADDIVSYIPGTYVTSHTDESKVLGIPDYTGINSESYVSLGNGGTVIVKFTDNSLTTSGSSDSDLWIFEVGTAVEATDVYISKDVPNWIFVGRVEGAKSGIDIDEYIGNGVILGDKYSYVKLIDDEQSESGTTSTAGADIDAVGAISSSTPVITECNDADNDGVVDQWDACPDTPADSCVNKNGCVCEGLYTQEQVDQIVSNILCWGDTNDDGKIGLQEAINALQVTTCIKCKK